MPIAQLASNTTDERFQTFVIEGEGHTLGNALRCVIGSYTDVEFCGYTVPHPSEDTIHLRIQMYSGRAVDALKRGLEDMVKMCDITMKKFDESVTNFKDHFNIE